jgi:hypothetical protein
VRLAYGFDREEAKKYLNKIEAKMKGQWSVLGKRKYIKIKFVA